MSEKEKLDLACKELKQALKNQQVEKDYAKLWREFALKGSIQSRKARALQNGRGIKL